MNETEDSRRHDAAKVIQKSWRKRKNVEPKPPQAQEISSHVRWKSAAVHAKMKVDRTAADEGRNHLRERWNRAVFFASQLRNGNAMLKDHGVDSDSAVQKHLETQHWLELVDGKHRYGSNLKYYHQRWQDESTDDNFFKWLDHGEGKDLSLPECPREQLEKEKIAYLSPDQRLNYLVNIDPYGKLRWARNDELVDTTPGHWKDCGDGKGVVPDDPEASPERPRPESRGSFESVSSMSSRSTDSNAATHYVGDVKGRNPWSKFLHRYLTPKGVLNRLLRKTVRRNTWMWVTDQHYNMFIGIKDTGSFQHSSFLAGGLVTSAGLISVKQGLIYNLSPLSGHYRTSVGHFHQFLDKMEQQGVDMKKARISKAEAALWGIETIAKFKKKQTEVTRKGKEKIVEAGREAAAKLPFVEESWKNDILEGRRGTARKSSSPPQHDGGTKDHTKVPDGK